MKSLQKKALAAAVVAACGVGAAEAVYQNPNGTGQVLIYPYYTVQQVGGKSMNTLITVVNTTTRAKVAKVRFREGKASKEVLDFLLFLSPNDVWTAAVVPADATESSGGRLLSFDKSCTNPAIPAGGVDFRNFEYKGADGLGDGLDRTREGYLEILELATLRGTAANAVTHNSLGVPNNCAAVRTANGAISDPTNNLGVPTGGLSGTGTIINVAQGSDIGYNAVALANWKNSSTTPSLGTESNNLSEGDAASLVSMTLPLGSSNAEVPVTILAAFGGTPSLDAVDAVSSTMMATSVINEYVLDAATASNTDWVLTFPTRHYYHDKETDSSSTNPFTADFLDGEGVCEPIQITYFNREEAGAVAQGSDFSPAPPSEVSAVCYESTIISFRSGKSHHPTGLTSAVLGSKNITPVTVGTFDNGWAELAFTGSGSFLDAAIVDSAAVTGGSIVGSVVGSRFRGLPVTGFMVRSFTNNTAGTCDVVPCQYNASFGHKYRTKMEASVD